MSDEGQRWICGSTTFSQRATDGSVDDQVDAIVSELVMRLLVDPDDTHVEAVDAALAALGQHFCVDRAYVIELSSDREHLSNTFEWCATGTEPVSDMLQAIPLTAFPWAIDTLRAGAVIASDVSDLPLDASTERASLDEQSVRSLLLVPLRDHDDLVGMVGFDQITHTRRWSRHEIDALERVGVPLRAALSRLRGLERLRTSEEQLRMFAERLDHGACILDEALERGFFANPAFESITGIAIEEFLMDPRSLRRVVHPDDLGDLDLAVGQLRLLLDDPDEAAPAVELSCRLVVDGALRWVKFTIFSLERSALERRVGALAEDITERRALQHELTVALQRAATANQAKTEFLSRVSHELRTPLHGTMGFLELLSREPDSPERARFLESAQRSCEQLVSLIDELLEVTRIESGRLELQLSLVDLGELVDDVVVLATSSADDHQVTVSTERPEHPVVVRTDRRRLGQVLSNLVSNGVKYNRRGGHVLVRVADDRDGIDIDVIDDGIGIAEDDLARLFVPYDRLGASETEIAGSGIGLSVTRQLTAALGADLHVESEPGAGSTFRVRLPHSARRHLDDSATYTVLCVDDSPSSLDVLEAAIGRIPGVRLRTALTLDDALSIAVVDRPDLVLLDRHLPDGDGLDAIGRFLALTERDRPVRVAMVTADLEPRTHETAIQRGALRLFTKPLDLGELVGFVGAHASVVST